MAAKARSYAIGYRSYAAWLGRFGLFLALWLMLIGFSPLNLAAGVPAAAAALWVSLWLLPPSSGAILSYRTMAGVFLRLPWQSLIAGFDVARRALDPRMPLRAGFVRFPTRIPAGSARDAFCALMALQPGTLPVRDGDHGGIAFHCLDTAQPVAADLAVQEARFLRMLGRAPGDV